MTTPSRSPNDLNAKAQQVIDAFNIKDLKERLEEGIEGLEVENLKVGLIKAGRYRVSFVAVDR